MTTKKRPKLSPDFIHPEALKIVRRLQKEGFATYLVGGCVRDLLAGIQPKDFDIATYASPKQVKKNVPDAYIIGKRFRLVLVKRGSDLFEVATFRRDPKPDEVPTDEKFLGDNLFGTPEEDANRRDFTLNALFYDPVRDELIDYCGGMKDVREHTVRMIGDPYKRLEEDPIRILRALRLAHKLDFSIDSQLRAAMTELAPSLAKSVLPRRREEILKILRLPDPSLTLMEAHDLGLLSPIFPTLNEVYRNMEQLSEFNSYLERIPEFVGDLENPAELFGYFMLAYYRSAVNSDPYARVVAIDFLKDEQLKKFMALELGMFNLEQSMVAKALEMQNRLKKVANPEDPRNQFVQSEAFPLAMMMARADYALSADKLLKWETALSQASQKTSKRRR